MRAKTIEMIETMDDAMEASRIMVLKMDNDGIVLIAQQIQRTNIHTKSDLINMHMFDSFKNGNDRRRIIATRPECHWYTYVLLRLNRRDTW